jgi:CubicO group peptidase (beta-lactamase class C family)
MSMIVAARPMNQVGKRYRYSDINFEVLGELVHRVSAKPLDRYAAKHIFAPLGMMDTRFQPSQSLRYRTAPTKDDGERMYWAEVHDATARRMGGIAGHAGLFSTADDLAIYARMLMNGGAWRGAQVLQPRTIKDMIRAASPAAAARARGLGWDLGGAKGHALFPAGSYGHLGFTGTMIWINPGAEIFAIVLTNRSYPDGKGDAGPLRKDVIASVMSALASRTTRRQH